MLNFLGGLFSAGADLFGSSQNVAAQEKINQENLQATEYVNTGQNLPQYYKNLVSGAQGAGLNPLAVLGANTPSQAVQLQAPQSGAGSAAAGQDISRALSAMSDSNQKQQLAQIEMMNAQTDKLRAESVATLDNAMARRYGAAGSPPGIGNSNAYSVKRPYPGRSRFSGYVRPANAYTYARLPNGSIVPVPTKEFSQQTMTRAADVAAYEGAATSLVPGRDYDDYIASVRPDTARWFNNMSDWFMSGAGG